MEAHGVQIATEKPRRYEMTPDARHRLVSQAPPKEAKVHLRPESGRGAHASACAMAVVA